MHHVTSLYAKPAHTSVHACLAVTCSRLHFWQNDRDHLRATAVTRGWDGYRNQSHVKVDKGEDNSPAAPAGTRTNDLSTSHESGAVTTELPLLPSSGSYFDAVGFVGKTLQNSPSRIINYDIRTDILDCIYCVGACMRLFLNLQNWLAGLTGLISYHSWNLI